MNSKDGTSEGFSIGQRSVIADEHTTSLYKSSSPSNSLSDGIADGIAVGTSSSGANESVNESVGTFCAGSMLGSVGINGMLVSRRGSNMGSVIGGNQVLGDSIVLKVVVGILVGMVRPPSDAFVCMFCGK
jgi:hypothetical protein